jgi:hypothetical protein
LRMHEPLGGQVLDGAARLARQLEVVLVHGAFRAVVQWGCEVNSVWPSGRGAQHARRDAPGQQRGRNSKRSHKGRRHAAAAAQASSPETRNPPFSGGSTLSDSLFCRRQGHHQNRIHRGDEFIALVIHLARNRQVGGASTPSHASLNFVGRAACMSRASWLRRAASQDGRRSLFWVRRDQHSTSKADRCAFSMALTSARQVRSFTPKLSL